MSLNDVPAGKNLPDEVNVIIEIPAYSSPVKYEVDKDTGALFVDRFMATCMQYPANYGYVNKTLSDDGDPVDVLVMSPHPLIAGSVIKCRPVGVLNMTDESGQDAKVIAVPVDKLSSIYTDVKNIEDVPALLKSQIEHFFSHYKDLEKGKWVKIEGWADVDAAKAEITSSVERYNTGA
ncbi:inorganic diphosphatase [Glaciecola sp. KUL10]|jgi:inorganic pyrophosphatase|uniref:inorganic diphosphatase n=1 Tax=Glaciecola sp. (strain KUL10) TaxID=2161813 RepID=UPI000D7876A4|nr:inorganic diphosphatase [Glaciecola sp. KUL10]GBL03601.1 inorganic diphosphatase [Glaciecola sp. KUL10]